MSDDSRVRELIARWEQARKAAPGAPPLSAEELCRDAPHLLPQVQLQILKRLKSDSEAETIPDPEVARRQHPSGFSTPGEDETASKLPLPRVPGYELIEEIGRGGMGVVYKARHTWLNRVVALKMILAGAHASGKARARFRIEAGAVERLKHPNIVQIHDMGEQDGCPFFALEYMNAGNVDTLLAEGPLTPRHAAQLLAPIARALHHAHLSHIVHRDLKPANILLHIPEGKTPTNRDERIELATPKLTDFGLAKELSSSTRLTRTGVAIGTPSYMAPEQALAQADRIGPATDIYGLGALLFEMLNGRPPFDAPSDLEVLQAVVHVPPVFGDHPKDRDWERIESICLQCLAKRPEDRYVSAQALADDFERVIQKQTVSARPSLWARYASPWLTPWFVGGVGILLVLGLCLAIYLIDQELFVFLGPASAVMLVIVFLFHWSRRPVLRSVSGGSGDRTPSSQPALLIDSVVTHTRPPIRVGVLHSLTGTMMVSETTVYEAVLLAIHELNRAGGLLGRPIEAVVADGHSDAVRFARESERLIVHEKVCTVFGCWTSASRRSVKPIFEELDHLLIYPLQYEGLERSPNIIYLGAAPNQQLIPAVEWCMKHLGKRRFFLIGSDYVFPHAANAIMKDALQRLGGEVASEEYLGLGNVDAAAVIERIKATQPDVILNTINGDSNLAFFRALRKANITPDWIPTISFSIAEHEFRTLGVTDMVGDYAAWNYFQSIDTQENRDFLKRLHAKFGSQRVATDPMETAYCAVHLWAQAVKEAGCDKVEAIRAAMRHQRFRGPGGLVEIDPTTQHAIKIARIGRIRADGQFDIVWSSPTPLSPKPYPESRTQAEWDRFLEDLQKQWRGQWANPGT